MRHVRQHADHGVRPIVHLEDLADDRAIAAELLRQYEWLRTSTAVAPGLSSSATKVRPTIGAMPRTSKKFERHDAGVDAIGLAAAQQIEIHLVELDQAVEVGRVCSR